MIFFKNALSQLLKQRFLVIAIASCLVISGATVVFRSYPVYAVDIPTTVTPTKKAPYSKVFFTGSVYAVKDKDYVPGERSVGLFSVWSENPTNNRLRVAVRYCVPNQLIADSGAHLTGMTLLDKNQPLVNINQDIRENSAQLRVTQPSESFYLYGEDDFLDDPFWDPLGDDFGYVAPVYVPAVTCSAGGSRFDFTQSADAIAQLPNRTLQVKLMFSNGATQNRRLGKGTVQALKDLVAIRQTLMNSPKVPARTPGRMQ